MNKAIYIYGLKESDTDEIRYVGKAKNPEKRRMQHLSDLLLAPRLEKSKWIAEVLGRNGSIEMEVLEICDKNNWREREAFWIDFYENKGISLTNVQRVVHPPKLNKPIKIRHSMSTGEAGRIVGLSSEGIRKYFSQKKLHGKMEGGWKGITPRLKIRLDDLHAFAKQYGFVYDREVATEICQEMYPPGSLTANDLIAAIPFVLAQLEPHERTSFILDALRLADGAGVEVAGCAVDCIESMIYWK